MAKKKACRRCKAITAEKICPICGLEDELSEDWSGLIIILNPENSQVAKALKITKPGEYALNVT